MRGKREMKRGKLERERGGRRGKERKQKKKKDLETKINQKFTFGFNFL